MRDLLLRARESNDTRRIESSTNNTKLRNGKQVPGHVQWQTGSFGVYYIRLQSNQSLIRSFSRFIC